MPTYSEVTITFENDWIETDRLKMITQINGVTEIGAIWIWEASRSGAYGVTTGTPTATAGERAAINFEAAFDLDYPTGYITTQTGNQVLIQSETDGEDFMAVGNYPSNTGTITLTFDNTVTPPTYANVSMALTASPHYIYTPFVYDTTTSATYSVYIWDGLLASVPATATRTATKVRPTINYDEFNVDISKLIKSEIDPTPVYNIAATTQLVDSNSDNVKWVYYEASYTDATATIATIVGTFIATDGYGYYSEGVNPTTPANAVLTSSTYRKVDRGSFILFPFVNNGTITSIDIDSDGAEINATETPTPTTQSSQYIQYVSVDISQATSDTYITITANPSGDVYTYEIVDECKYTPVTIVFKNKYGVYDTITMFKKQVVSLEVESEEFVNNYISGGTYTTTVHQFKKLNVTARESITLNSGYIKQTENELYKQMLMSDKVYFYIGGYVPVNVKTTSLEYKTRINDSLVKYTIDFDYAYNVINNV